MVLGLVVAAFAVVMTTASANATFLSYRFDSGNQGWIQSQDNGATTSSAGFQPTGGNPGGHLSARDTGIETGCPGAANCNLLTFFSPVVPALSANYGGMGAFDLRSSVDPEFGAELLLLPAGDRYLDGFIAEESGTTYHHLSIPLRETTRVNGKLSWAVCPYAGGTCTAPSQGEFQSLLGASDQVGLIVDVGADGTGETYDVDNFTLTDGPPAPPAAPPAATPGPQKKKKCKKKKKRRHGAAVAKKCKKHKKKKHHRAASVLLRG